jgi:hypothetical protein
MFLNFPQFVDLANDYIFFVTFVGCCIIIDFLLYGNK